MRYLTSGLCIFLLFAVPGCARIPQKEINSAKVAIEAAKVAGADRFCPELYRSACLSFDSAAARISIEQVKLPFAASYDVVAEQLRRSALAANASRSGAEAGRRRQAALADSLVDCAHTMLAVTARALVITRKVGPAVRDSLRNTADSAAGIAGIAEVSLKEEDYAGAAEAARSSIALIGPAWHLLAPRKNPDSTGLAH